MVATVRRLTESQEEIRENRTGHIKKEIAEREIIKMEDKKLSMLEANISLTSIVKCIVHYLFEIYDYIKITIFNYLY